MYSIVIPTHERHHVLIRAIDYYQSFNCKIFIADSSVKKLDYEFPDNVVYIHHNCLKYNFKKIIF